MMLLFGHDNVQRDDMVFGNNFGVTSQEKDLGALMIWAMVFTDHIGVRIVIKLVG